MAVALTALQAIIVETLLDKGLDAAVEIANRMNRTSCDYVNGEMVRCTREVSTAVELGDDFKDIALGGLGEAKDVAVEALGTVKDMFAMPFDAATDMWREYQETQQLEAREAGLTERARIAAELQLELAKLKASERDSDPGAIAPGQRRALTPEEQLQYGLLAVQSIGEMTRAVTEGIGAIGDAAGQHQAGIGEVSTEAVQQLEQSTGELLQVAREDVERANGNSAQTVEAINRLGDGLIDRVEGGVREIGSAVEARAAETGAEAVAPQVALAEGGGHYVLIGTPPGTDTAPQRPYVALLGPEGMTVYSLVPEGRFERSPDGSTAPVPGLLLEDSLQDRERCGAALAGEPGHELVQNTTPLSAAQAAQVYAECVEPYKRQAFHYGPEHTTSTDLPLAVMNGVGRVQDAELQQVQDAERGQMQDAERGRGGAAPAVAPGGYDLPVREPCTCADRFGGFQLHISIQMGGRDPLLQMFSFLGLGEMQTQTIEIQVQLGAGRTEPPGVAPPGGEVETPSGSSTPSEAGASLGEIEQRGPAHTEQERGD